MRVGEGIVRAPRDIHYNILQLFMFFSQTADYYNEKELDRT